MNLFRFLLFYIKKHIEYESLFTIRNMQNISAKFMILWFMPYVKL